MPASLRSDYEIAATRQLCRIAPEQGASFTGIRKWTLRVQKVQV